MPMLHVVRVEGVRFAVSRGGVGLGLGINLEREWEGGRGGV